MTTHRTNQIATTVGRNIRAARLAGDLTQKQVADAIGVTNRDVSRWENGNVEPGARYRYLIADVLFDGSVAAMYEEEGAAAR